MIKDQVSKMCAFMSLLCYIKSRITSRVKLSFLSIGSGIDPGTTTAVILILMIALKQLLDSYAVSIRVSQITSRSIVSNHANHSIDPDQSIVHIFY